MNLYIWKTTHHSLLKTVTEYLPVDNKSIEWKKEIRQFLDGPCGNSEAFECWCPYIDGKGASLWAHIKDNMVPINSSWTYCMESHPVIHKYQVYLGLEELDYPTE
jgi:hypothetical protein